MPTFRNGYNKHLDLTEDEYWEQQALDYVPEDNEPLSPPPPADFFEGEPFEDTYLPGIADYDRFNRPSWVTDQEDTK